VGLAFKIHAKGIVGTMARKVPNYHRPPLQDKWLQKGYTSEEAHAFCCRFIGLHFLSLLSACTERKHREKKGLLRERGKEGGPLDILAVIAGEGRGETNKTTAIKFANIFALRIAKAKTFAS
jgi:hypothetical protein